MDAVDKLREDLIKSSRDVQKLSKQAIFAVHRGNLDESKQKLDQAHKIIAESILARMAGSPSLRQGAISNCIEEWAEGVLFLEWMRTRNVVSKESLVIANDAEYVGGLSDFTGEIGRTAVAYATNRNIEGVKEVLQTDIVVLSALAELNSTGRFSKKVEAVVTNMRKIEDVVYELTLLSRGGRANREKSSDDFPVIDDGKNGDEAI
jgi:predicted translin family RNA/ssDNA-binding protein